MWCAEVLSSLLVKRCNAALRWQNRGAPCCWVCLAMLYASHGLMTQRAVVGGKDDFQRTDGINMIFFMAPKLLFSCDFFVKIVDECCKLFRFSVLSFSICYKCAFCFAISSVLFSYFAHSLPTCFAALLRKCA